jgi:hypothetical protein
MTLVWPSVLLHVAHTLVTVCNFVLRRLAKACGKLKLLLLPQGSCGLMWVQAHIVTKQKSLALG